MRRRFVILAAPLSPTQETAVRDYIAKKGPWWHWIDNVWLMTTEDQKLKTEHIRDYILTLSPKARVVVFEFPEDVDWAASGSTSSAGDKTISDWLKATWSKP